MEKLMTKVTYLSCVKPYQDPNDHALFLYCNKALIITLPRKEEFFFFRQLDQSSCAASV